MYRLYICVLLGLVAALATSVDADASEVTLEAAATLRVSNPEDTGDVRYLCRFEIPDSIVSADIVWARLTVRTQAHETVSLVSSPVEFEWTSTETWNTLAVKAANSTSFQGSGDDPQVSSNEVALNDGEEEDLGYSVPAGEWVRRWIDPMENHGLCVRRLQADISDVGAVLQDGMPSPTLLIVYVNR